jgi:hypothetical protein
VTVEGRDFYHVFFVFNRLGIIIMKFADPKTDIAFKKIFGNDLQKELFIRSIS